jgi:beta-phosphoglucomutase-like phosphatase (HAD superfamily)
MFDRYLREQGDERPFDEHDDYDTYVDGKPRAAGVRDFLASRGMHPSDEEIAHLGDLKNDIVLELIKADGVEAYPGSVRYLEAARDAGLRRAVVSSSHNCQDVLEAAGIDHLLEERVDGVVADELHLAGVEAGRAGAFGYVIGLNRVGQREALLEHGADSVVDDLEELL